MYVRLYMCLNLWRPPSLVQQLSPKINDADKGKPSTEPALHLASQPSSRLSTLFITHIQPYTIQYMNIFLFKPFPLLSSLLFHQTSFHIPPPSFYSHPFLFNRCHISGEAFKNSLQKESVSSSVWKRGRSCAVISGMIF